MAAIWIVEDDPKIGLLIEMTVRKTGHAAVRMPDAVALERALKKQVPPDLLLLDLMLREKNGFAVMKEWKARAETRRIPVIIISARSAEHDKVMGLELGAEDYITKPFGVRELQARVQAALRRLLAGMYPDFFFREIPVGELGKTDVSGWKKPFILKPSVGFFSLGVYTITSDDDWTAAVADIERNLRESRDRFPESVVDQSSFLVEEYITGEEFAVDVYFDGEGEPIILNIFTPRFASLSDVSDRLYYTGKDVIEANKARFEAFFRKVNALMGIRDFPAHVELRVEGDRILPIEFNAMRFAGLCTTDMAYFAFGINTVDCYLNDRKPDFDAILRGRGGKIYSMVILDKPKSLPPSSAFDYDRLAAHFAKVLELRKVDVPELPVFGFAFTESDAERTEELDTILQSDLTEFLR